MAQEQQVEGDDTFIGFASRLDAANLKPGMLQASFNARLQRGIAQPRKGTKRLTKNDLIELTMVAWSGGKHSFLDELGSYPCLWQCNKTFFGGNLDFPKIKNLKASVF